MDNDKSSIDRMMEFGIGLGIARMVPDFMSNCMREGTSSIPTPPPVSRAADATYIVLNNTQAGPLSQEELEKLVTADVIKPSTLVWRQGMSQWMPAEKVPEVNKLFLLGKIKQL